MFKNSSRTEPVTVPAAPGNPAANADTASTREVAWVKRFPLRFKSTTKWMTRFLHGGK